MGEIARAKGVSWMRIARVATWCFVAQFLFDAAWAVEKQRVAISKTLPPPLVVKVPTGVAPPLTPVNYAVKMSNGDVLVFDKRWDELIRMTAAEFTAKYSFTTQTAVLANSVKAVPSASIFGFPGRALAVSQNCASKASSGPSWVLGTPSGNFSQTFNHSVGGVNFQQSILENYSGNARYTGTSYYPNYSMVSGYYLDMLVYVKVGNTELQTWGSFKEADNPNVNCNTYPTYTFDFDDYMRYADFNIMFGKLNAAGTKVFLCGDDYGPRCSVVDPSVTQTISHASSGNYMGNFWDYAFQYPANVYTVEPGFLIYSRLTTFEMYDMGPFIFPYRSSSPGRRSATIVSGTYPTFLYSGIDLK